MTETNGHAEAPLKRRRQLYGRRVGRAIGTVQSGLLEDRLPALRLDPSAPFPANPPAMFDTPVDDLWLEVGFGAGEHLIWQARANPRIGFIGCEPFLNGVAKTVHAATENGLRNLRLYDDDARNLLTWLPPSTLGRVFVLFPDPWPKVRHRKRRFLTDEGLALLARAMRPGAQLRFASDIADYSKMVLQGIDHSPEFRLAPGLVPRPEDWPLTRYAEKALEAGRECRFFIFERI